jgi:hypothetical protein
MQPDPSTRRVEFLDRGYIVARGFFSRTEMESLCADLRTARPRVAGADWLTAGAMVFRSNLYFHSPRIQAFISQPVSPSPARARTPPRGACCDGRGDRG